MTWSDPTTPTTRPDLQGWFGMAASTHWLASSTAQSVLERGGNAFDAAVAGAFVLHLVEPHLNGLGGDLVGIVRPAGAEPRVLMGQGPAPHGATLEHFAAEGLDRIPGSGALAAAVPGVFDAWLLLLRDHGTWEVADAFAYAIDLAERGHPLLGRTAATITTMAPFFAEKWPTSAERWLVDGRPPVAGEIVRAPVHAALLRRLAEAATGSDRAARIDAVRAEWRTGFVAQAIAEFVAQTPHEHSSGTVHRGVLDADDLAGFQASFEDTVTLEFRGRTIHKAGPWSSGPVLLECLALLDGFDDDALNPSTALGVHTITEVLKLALADREAYYGEGLSADRLSILIGADYASRRRALVGAEASRALRPGDLDPEPSLPPLREDWPAASSPTTGEPTVDRSGTTRGDTVHIDVVDRWGNLASVTPSGGWLQSSPTIPSLGFCLGTRLQMSWLDPLSPSGLRPGARPRTTLSPTLVTSADGSAMALGTPGGDQQDQWQLLFLLRVLVGGMSPQEAIDAPMFHTTSFPESFWPRTWTPGGLVVEGRLGADVIASLEERGHRITTSGDWSLGRLSCVTRDAAGLLGAAANPRGAQGYAVGR